MNKMNVIASVADRPPTFLNGSLADALLLGRPGDDVMLPDSRMSIRVDGLRELLRRRFRLEPLQFAQLHPVRQNEVTRKVVRMVEREFRRQHPEQWRRLHGDSKNQAEHDRMEAERTQLHRDLLVNWSQSPLKLEPPQGSSYHHLLDYEIRANTEKLLHQGDEPQLVVVENDWARALAGRDLGGEVRLPWPEACWEMRVSGVRVMVFTVVDAGRTTLLCIYGRGGTWVADDYGYEVTEQGGLVGTPHTVKMRDPREFRRVADFVHVQIRAACILLDVEATRAEHVPAPRKLAERRAAEGRPQPRDHVVVRLMKSSRPHAHRAHSAGAGTGGSRAPQRGHLRRGTWVHYQDQDAGEVQYVNSGGFWVSKTWRPWHWAGDLENMIEREYRL